MTSDPGIQDLLSATPEKNQDPPPFLPPPPSFPEVLDVKLTEFLKNLDR